MSHIDDFRFDSQKLLVELDATTTKMMVLVASKKVTGPEWEDAVKDQKSAFDDWISFLNSPELSIDRSDLI
ncbi:MULTISPECIES: hypothetical protein [Pseudomonas]|jgi:hypothetical protein|uniref:Uncharacterized protein n=1 Tax=Pseudomonas veronii 1YdBTEX2 TaxID=1295141 RepID=A0A1D3JVJ0_PSEVE|nr:MULTISPECIES: hypothetical protein [Pseudomonas]PMU93760.1 hypothetical protein C1Y30_02015 [Pseudomonas sp. GW704-F3]PMU96751.1 hypothetical protein C1Y28_04590 [Pseudomonas sp. GW704-F5]PMV04756.1 hypothetical protein C1Y29_11435 [Pseudomonas sp. MPBD4-3]PMV34822.1 hypothetical protein C1Y27_05905 [Pseudomonas sp. GW704-F2]SBW80090.1 Conserved hypothetical protein [Pseudomonas veronii 1YdBTEX2]